VLLVNKLSNTFNKHVSSIHRMSTPRAYDNTPLPTVGATACPADEPRGPWSLVRRRHRATKEGSSRNTTAVPPLLLLDLDSDAAGEGWDRATFIQLSQIDFTFPQETKAQTVETLQIIHVL